MGTLSVTGAERFTPPSGVASEGAHRRYRRHLKTDAGADPRHIRAAVNAKRECDN